MTGNAYPAALRRVIINLSRWPGVGEKTASRLAMHLLRAPESEVLELANALMELKEKIRLCRRCFAFADQELCPLCADPARRQGQILVVAEPGDLLAIEKVGWFKGLYHVLGGVIAPLEGVGPGRYPHPRTAGPGQAGGGPGGDSGPQPLASKGRPLPPMWPRNCGPWGSR